MCSSDLEKVRRGAQGDSLQESGKSGLHAHGDGERGPYVVGLFFEKNGFRMYDVISTFLKQSTLRAVQS